MIARPRIAVAGVGAIGSVVAARLATAGHAVTLVARGSRASELETRGLRVDGKPSLYLPVLSADKLEKQDIIFLAVKEAGVASLLEAMRFALRSGTLLVPLVNGLPFWLTATRVFPASIIGSVVFIKASVNAEGEARSVGEGHLILGAVEPDCADKAEVVADVLRGAGLRADVSSDIRRDVWSKIALNLATNPLSVVAQATLKEQFQNPSLNGIVKAILEETIILARSQNVEPSMTLEEMIETGAGAGSFYTSMYQDYKAGRPLELDAIAWRCIDLGKQMGVMMPVAESIANLCAYAEKKRDTDCMGGAIT